MATLPRIGLLFIIVVLLSIGSFSSSSDRMIIDRESPGFKQTSQTQAIERELFNFINRERRQIGLPLLEISPELTVLARSHSADMAEQDYFSHNSKDGRTYKDRLVEGNLYFRRAGENIAFSETYITDFIHQSLMESPKHREEILTPAYDQVGIGVASNDKAEYYITQDFRKAISPLDSNSAEQYLRERVNSKRSQNSAAPLFYNESASVEARKFSRLKVDSDVRPNVGNRYGATDVDFIVTYSLDSELVTKRSIDEKYGEAGIGVHFSRNAEHPGGAYFITLFLFPRTMFRGLSPVELQEKLLSTVNSFREGRGLGSLHLDSWLSHEASRIAKAGESRINILDLGASFRGRLIYVNSYITNDPSRLPQPSPSKLDDPSIRSIGIGIFFGRTETVEREVYTITLILST